MITLKQVGSCVYSVTEHLSPRARFANLRTGNTNISAENKNHPPLLKISFLLSFQAAILLSLYLDENRCEET